MGGREVLEENEILDHMTNSVSERVSEKVRETLSLVIQDEISKALTRALNEGQFYKTLNSEVTDSLGTVYSEIRAVKQLIGRDSRSDSASLLMETDSILDGIVKATEYATLKIIDSLEEIQSEFKEMEGLLDRGDPASCKDKLNRLESMVMDIMTELSFQDLTGQQIKKVIQLLKKIEEVSFEAYVTTELIKKTREKAPDKSLDDIRRQTREIVQDARAQKERIDQEGVDSLMEQLGM